MTTYKSIDEANEAIAQKIISAQPTLVDVVAAKTVIPELEDKLILHAGPPIAFEDMPDPVQGAAIGAALFEGWASDEDSARRVCAEEVRFAPNNDFRAVGAMGGILSGNLPVFVVENRTDGNRSYTTMHEGEGKVLRFGVYDESVGEHLRWMRDVLGVALSRALKLLPGGGLAVNPILAQAVAMGDEFHVRNTAASSLVYREIGPKLTQAGLPQRDLESVSEFLAGNINFFLTLAMASAKATLDAAATIRAGSVVTCLTRNGREFAIRVSGTGDRGSRDPRTSSTRCSSRGSPRMTRARTAATAPSSRPTDWVARSPSLPRRCSRWSAPATGGSRTPWPRARSRRRSWSPATPTCRSRTGTSEACRSGSTSARSWRRESPR